ncbi:MAG: response regulator transcription factor [Kiritimatiellia bacterium]|jgi:two-component system chemotaxis response regulator CheY|nr:response regulator transcription factor [Kiritimatiellia bacterium]MDP6847784.1 response regulator transcription factor [Kiritimatiellia bacterium]
MNETTLRVVLADDEPHVRAYLRSVIKNVPAEVVGEASNGQEAIDIYSRNRPDLLLIDLNMPIVSGQEAIAKIVANSPDAKIIVLSAVSDRMLVEECRDIGASNFILKDTDPDEIVNIVRETMRRT